MSTQYFIQIFHKITNQSKTFYNKPKKKNTLFDIKHKCTAFITEIMIQFAFSMNIFAKISKLTFEDLTCSCPKVFKYRYNYINKYKYKYLY